MGFFLNVGIDRSVCWGVKREMLKNIRWVHLVFSAAIAPIVTVQLAFGFWGITSERGIYFDLISIAVAVVYGWLAAMLALTPVAIIVERKYLRIVPSLALFGFAGACQFVVSIVLSHIFNNKAAMFDDVQLKFASWIALSCGISLAALTNGDVYRQVTLCISAVSGGVVAGIVYRGLGGLRKNAN